MAKGWPYQLHPRNLAEVPQSSLVPVENCRQSGDVDRRCEKIMGHELRISVAKRTDLTVKAHFESIKAGLCQSWHCYSQDLRRVSHFPYRHAFNGPYITLMLN